MKITGKMTSRDEACLISVLLQKTNFGGVASDINITSKTIQ